MSHGPRVWSEKNRTVLVDEASGYKRELTKMELAELGRTVNERLAFLIVGEELKALPPGFDGR